MTRSQLAPLRDVIKRHGLGAKRSLGQHFLLDLNLTDRIARTASITAEDNVIEIGPGPGGLSRALLDSPAKRVFAIEKDPRCIDALAELSTTYPDRFHLIHGDALEIDLTEAVPAPRRIVANLPYNVATPLLIKWLRIADKFSGMTLMFQTEVAERLIAQPRTKAYGRLSVITQWRCAVSKAFNVPKDAFTPPPKVSSSVVNLTPRAEPLGEAQWESLETVTAAAFGQRRKMLRSSLKSLNIDPETVEIPGTARAEELSVEQFCVLARVYDKARRSETR